MPPYCKPCNKTFKSTSGFTRHLNSTHKNPLPEAPASNFRFHPSLTGRPCRADSTFLPHGADPEVADDDNDGSEFDWTPFQDRPSFHFAEHSFEKMETSKGDVNELLRILEARDILYHGENANPIFYDSEHLLDTIDAIDAGEVSWGSFSVSYTGPVNDDSPSWKRTPWVVHARDTLSAVRTMLANPDFKDRLHIQPFEEYTGPHKRRFSDFMSGSWAWKQADMIAHDPNTHGSMMVPIILGADKTTVSVATGNTEYHPVYMSLGNLFNEDRRAHGEALIPIAFLAIPKASREHTDDDEFRLFKKQLYHASLAHILEPLHEGMTTPVVLRCPDGHWRRVIFEIGPFIADYPEQVFLAGIVQGWCPKCLAHPSDLDAAAATRFREHTEVQVTTFDAITLWDTFGTVADVVPFTSHFPRADIYELLSPDILHQLIKGTFKDHLVAWVEDFIRNEHGPSDADRIMDDIDRRIAAAPAFPGLRRFPEGRNYKQWTGDDSKALMKVYLPAIVGYVPDRMVKCIAAFLDFCYMSRRSAHDNDTLLSMQATLDRFHDYRQVFIDVDVRPDGFSLPRQHSLVHHVSGIRLFASLNGLCSSITESKHIRAVKKPWRRSSRYKPLGQIIRTNTRLSKLAAMRARFQDKGMLDNDMVSAARAEAGLDDDWVDTGLDGVNDVMDADGPRGDPSVVLATKYAYSQTVAVLAGELDEPQLRTMLQQFLYNQLHGDEFHSAEDVLPIHWPPFDSPIRIYNSAIATFYAPSELSGRGGMHRERIRSTARWFGQHERRDTVLIQNGTDADAMGGMIVGRVIRLISFRHGGAVFPCAVVTWFLPEGALADPVTGMWVVRPETLRDRRTIGVVHLDCIIRACHLLPKFGRAQIPPTFSYSDSLDAFRLYYVNQYADYHSHETIPR